MDPAQKRQALSYPKPVIPWRGEPQLGGWYTEEEVEAAVAAIRSSMDWTGEGFGFIVQEILDFEAAFARYTGAKHAISLSTASVGLDLAMMALDLQPGDEVISPAMNFRAAHHAIIGAGGKLILCEVDPATLCADPADVERRVTPRTRAICVTHMNGRAAPLDDYVEIGRRHPHPEHGPIPVIGDAARAVGVGYKGGRVGAGGWCTVFSFHTMKLMTTLGEGGMVTTNDDALAERLTAARQWGGTTEYWGSSFKLTKVQAAVGLVQLRRLDEMNGLRIRRALERTELLKDVPELTLPPLPGECGHTYYLYTVFVPPEWAGEKRDRIRAVMLEEFAVGSEVANPPTYDTSPHIRKHTEGQRLPATELLAKRMICVPIHPLMTEEQNAYVAAALQEAVERVRAEG